MKSIGLTSTGEAYGRLGAVVTATSAIALLLSGCATGQLQVGRASEMVKAGRATTDASRALVADTLASHDRLVAELAAIDPNCELPTPKIALGPSAWGGCVARPNQPGLTIHGPSRAYAKLSLATINGAVAYLDAIDAIATRKPIDIAGTLEGARDDLSGVIEAIGAASGAKLAFPVTADQLAAAKTLLNLLSELISVSEQVRDLKKVEAQLDNDEFDTSISKLTEVTSAWTAGLESAVREEEAQVDAVRTLQASRIQAICATSKAPHCPYRALSPDDRDEFRSYAERKLSVIFRQEQVQALKVKVPALMTTFVQAHEDYRSLLFDPRNTKLTPAERKLKAEIIQRQIISAIKGVLAVVAVL